MLIRFDDKTILKLYLKDYLKSTLNSSNLIDKTILIMSPIMLTVLFTLLLYFKNNTILVYTAPFILICFFFSFLFNFRSQFISNLISNNEAKKVASAYMTDNKYEIKINKATRHLKVLNKYSSFLFCIGFILLTFFITSNVINIL